MNLRAVIPADLPRLHLLNEQSTPGVSSLTIADLEWFHAASDHFSLVEVDGEIAGFLLGLRPGLAYRSPNYAWFNERYADFVYIDRLTVDARWRRQGIASDLYADVERHARAIDAPLLACEVNVRPRNDASLVFHERHNFAEVGRQDTEGGAKRVALMIKPLAVTTADA